MGGSFFSLLTLAWLNLAAFSVGWPVARSLRLGADRFTVAVWGVALGWVAAGLGLTVLGLIGFLTPGVIGVATMAAGFGGLSFMALAAGVADSSDEFEPSDSSSEKGNLPALDSDAVEPPSARLAFAVALVVLLAMGGSLAGALVPPTAGDALCYHLDLPKRFLADGQISCLPFNDNATFPLLSEMWYAWALAVDGEVAAQLIHWEMGLLFALASVLLASPILGRTWAVVVGAVVLLVPGVTNQMTAPLNDVALAAMTTLALAAWWRAVIEEESPRWLIAAGIAAGAAMGIKYVAILFFAALGLVWLALLMRRAEYRGRFLKQASAIAAVSILVGGVWYARAFWHRGNPVYPFFQSQIAADAESLDSKKPLGRHPAALAASPWLVTVEPERFGGRGHQLGLVFLVMIPGIAVVRRLRGLGILLGLAAVYWCGWFYLRQNVRFLFPILAPLACGAVWTWSELRRAPPFPRAVIGAILAGSVGLGVLLPLARCRDSWRVPFGLESREHYLSRCEPSYPIAMAANQVLDGRSHVLTEDYRTFYFTPQMTRESVFRRETGYDLQIDSPGRLSATLRANGFSYVLLAETCNAPTDRAPDDNILTRLVASEWQKNPEAYRLLAENRFPMADGSTRRFRLLAIAN